MGRRHLDTRLGGGDGDIRIQSHSGSEGTPGSLSAVRQAAAAAPPRSVLGQLAFFSAQVVPRTSILPPALRNAARSEAIESLLTTVLRAPCVRCGCCCWPSRGLYLAGHGCSCQVEGGGKRPGISLAQVVLPLAAVIAAHRKLAADRRRCE